MPRSLAQSSLSTLTRCHVGRASTATTVARALSTTAPRLRIGPESPRYVEVPQPPQQSAPIPRDIKGKLPVPRDLFPRRAGDKTSDAYFQSTTPLPTSVRATAAPANEYVAWKRKMASTRRDALRESLLALHERKVIADRQIARRSAAKRAAREAALNRPPRDDERLTATTIRAFNKPQQQHAALPDPRRAARVAAKQAQAVAAKEAKTDLRREALHTLYVDAHTFITDMSQLNAAIDEEFAADKFSAVRPGARSIWDTLGAPLSSRGMLAQSVGRNNTVVGTVSPATLNNRRVVRIAEELTGGKMGSFSG